jgi:hypothetical protein
MTRQLGSRGRRLVEVLVLGAATAGAIAACEEDEVVLPTPPDVSSLRAAYDTPTGTLSGDGLACAAAAAMATIDDNYLDALQQLIGDGLTSVRQRLIDSGLPIDDQGNLDAEELRVRGSIVVTRICQGWDPAATVPDQASNGDLTLTALVDESKLQKVVWGAAHNCLARVDVLQGTPRAASIDLFFNGDVVVGLDRGLPADWQSAGFLVKVDAVVGTAELRRQVSFDFHVRFPQLELRLPGEGGDIIAVVDPTAPSTVTLRTRDGTTTVAPGDCSTAATRR